MPDDRPIEQQEANYIVIMHNDPFIKAYLCPKRRLRELEAMCTHDDFHITIYAIAGEPGIYPWRGVSLAKVHHNPPQAPFIKHLKAMEEVFKDLTFDQIDALINTALYSMRQTKHRVGRDTDAGALDNSRRNLAAGTSAGAEVDHTKEEVQPPEQAQK